MKTIQAILSICFVLVLFGIRVAAQTRIFPSAVPQAEPHIAINPTDPHNLIVVAITQLTSTPNRIAVYYSYNAGQSWSEIANLVGSASGADPVVGFDGDGAA